MNLRASKSFKVLESKQTIGKWFTENKVKREYYLCLYETINVVLFWNRLLGILPIIAVKKKSHNTFCRFEVSRRWLMYSYFIQILYIPFFVITTSMRLSCGPQSIHGSSWYVMSIGYIIGDINNIVILVMGIIRANDICKILAKLTSIPGLIGEMRRLRKTLKLAMVFIIGGYFIVLSFHLYVAWLRFKKNNLNLHCYLLDTTFGVIFRGVLLIIPGIFISLIMFLCLLIIDKFHQLGDKTTLTLDIDIEFSNSTSNIFTTTIDFSSSTSKNQLNQLANAHREITACLTLINKCVGLQLLSEICNNLYSTVFYLYRYSTASSDKITSNSAERYHYVAGLIYRSLKLLTYIGLGNGISNSSREPLEALQKSKIINLPTRLQQQVQSLILQWSGKKLTLSAFGIVDVGSWLMAPIIGNVITYLLVTLQFESGSKNHLYPNITTSLDNNCMNY